MLIVTQKYKDIETVKWNTTNNKNFLLETFSSVSLHKTKKGNFQNELLLLIIKTYNTKFAKQPIKVSSI